MTQNVDAKTLLGELKSLRFFNGESEEFWPEYLSKVALLCKSPFAVSYVWNSEKKEWGVLSAVGLDTDLKGFQPEIIQMGLNISQRAMQNGFAFDRQRLSWIQFSQPTALAFKLDEMRDSVMEIVVFVLVDRTKGMDFNELVVRTQLIADIPKTYTYPSLEGSEDASDGFDEVLEITSNVINEKKFILACMRLVSDLAVRFNCSRVSIGWQKKEYCETIAISHLESFERNTDAINELENVFEEAFDQDEEILVPVVNDNGTIVSSHLSYLRKNGLTELLSLPIRVDEQPIGVILLEKLDEPFSEYDLMVTRLASNQISYIMQNLYFSDQWFYQKWIRNIKDSLAWVLGPEKTFIKLISLLITALILFVCIEKWEYKIEVSADLATENISFVSAPYDAVVHKVSAHSGDFVSKGDLLLTFDTEELYLKETEARSDVNRYDRESQKARASRKLADMGIAEARKLQVETKLKRIQYYLSQSKVRSPFDGIIIEGNKEDLIGAPISKGDLIFKIVQPTDIFLKLKVNERYIDDIKIGDSGKLALLSRPDTKFNFTIDKIIPVSEVDAKAGNIFVVKAKFNDSSEKWWRPGMSGVAKIEVGKKPIIWLFTHKMVDAIRLYFWW